MLYIIDHRSPSCSYSVSRSTMPIKTFVTPNTSMVSWQRYRPNCTQLFDRIEDIILLACSKDEKAKSTFASAYRKAVRLFDWLLHVVA